jgi:hypothetical protein
MPERTAVSAGRARHFPARPPRFSFFTYCRCSCFCWRICRAHRPRRPTRPWTSPCPKALRSAQGPDGADAIETAHIERPSGSELTACLRTSRLVRMPTRRTAKSVRPYAASTRLALSRRLLRIRGLAHDLSLDLVRASGALSATSAIIAEIEREADAALRALKFKA